jgi:NADPH:quinone reductase-like Zn-dependent oxidoreductase
MTEQGTPDVLRLVDLPDPVPGPGQVLGRVDAAAVNFSDVMRRRGDVYPVPTPSPFVPGAEVAGTVAVVGAGVDNFGVGAPVFGTVGADASGGYAELALAYAGSRLPDTAAALEQLVGWIASGQLSTPAVQAMPLSAAVEAHRLLESGRTTGKLVLKP